MEAHQGLEGLFGDPVDGRRHFRLGGGGEPGLVEFRRPGAVGRLAQASVRPAFHPTEEDLPLRVERWNVLDELRRQILEPGRKQHPIAHVLERAALGFRQVLESAERDVTLIPKAVAQQDEQEQQLARAGGQVEREEATGANLRALVEAFAPPLEFRQSLLARPAEQAAYPIVVVQDANIRARPGRCAVLGDVGAALFRDLAPSQEKANLPDIGF